VRFEILYAFVILDLGRREVVRVGVTSSPSSQYAVQSFVEAVCDRGDQAPRFLIHDRDSIYGTWLRRRLKGFGTRCLVTPPRSPQANSFCERVIGTSRRDLETITQFRGSAIALNAAAFSPKDSISLPLRRDVDRAQRGRETAEGHDRFHYHREAA
jgi:transposase InsO family protein